MIRRRPAAPLFWLCLTLLCALPGVAPAQAKEMHLKMSGSGLVVNGIPLPSGAVPSMAANLSLDDLHAMTPGSAALGQGRLQAVVYELQIAAPPDDVIEFYRREMQRPVALTVPDRLATGKAADDGTRVLQFLGNSYLAIRAEEHSRPSRVTVAIVEGRTAAPPVLDALETLRTGGGPKPTREPPLFSAGWPEQHSWDGPQIGVLQRYLQHGDVPGPVVDVLRALLQQARSLRLVSRLEPHVVPPPELLAAFRDEECFQTWTLVSVEEESPQEVRALYRLPRDTGMVLLDAGPPASRPPLRQLAASGTLITRFEVTGPIDFEALFHPTLLRPRPLLAPPVRGPLPRAPFTARPRR